LAHVPDAGRSGPGGGGVSRPSGRPDPLIAAVGDRAPVRMTSATIPASKRPCIIPALVMPFSVLSNMSTKRPS
jgi:hypothetical protein